jgi:phosphatidylglycerophosphate synthase
VAEAYQPASRRPIAGIFRSTARGAVGLCVRRGIHPDAVSYASIAASGAAGICFWQSGRCAGLLLLGPILCFIRLWLNMLDGMVALASGQAGARGEILNDLPDRVSDVLIFVGVGHSGLCALLSGYWAAIFALLTAYVGTLGQAVGAHREYSGLMSKPWRMVVLSLGACATFACIRFRGGDIRFGRLTILDWTCLIVIFGCLQTIFVRLRRIFVELASKQSRH